MTKKIKLNLSERIFAINILNQFKGDHETLAFILDDIKEFAITEEDWKKGERKIETTPNEKGEPMTTWLWNDEKGGEKEIAITDRVADYIMKKIGEKDKAGEFTLQDKAVISLSKKLEGK